MGEKKMCLYCLLRFKIECQRRRLTLLQVGVRIDKIGNYKPMNKNVAETALLDGRKRTEVPGSGLYARNLEREQEVMMHGLVELLAYLDDHYHFVLSCVRAPRDVGTFCVFCALFCLHNVGQGYDIILFANCNLYW